MDYSAHVAGPASSQVEEDPEGAHARPRELPQSPRLVDDEEKRRLSRVESFSKWLAGVVPVNLIPGDLAEMLQHRANCRFDMAREQGVPIDQIYFGQDCLPTWETLYWDPEEESLHSILQERLCDLERALELSSLLQHEIQHKSNARMKEACELGIALDAINVGPSLLPEWPVMDRAESANTRSSTQTSTLTADFSSSHGDEQTELSSMPLTIADDDTPETSFVDDTPFDIEVLDAQMDENDVVDLTDHSALEPTHLDAPVLKRKRCSKSWDSTSEDEDEDESSDGEEDDAEDIYLNNHVSSQPIYDEYGRSNILYDVELVGIPGEAPSIVDLEVYLAVDDDQNYEDLAEVELAIDRTAYEQCFGDEGAVDVHIPGAKIFCFNRIDEEEDADGSAEDVEEQDSGVEDEDDSDGDDEDDDEDDDAGLELEPEEYVSSSSDAEDHSEEE
ncbi:hypothetical protein E4U55_008143 [Claviceps digitariae]|nr:hypothetical protein E4U55_008143 [Claviceps digitariae]